MNQIPENPAPAFVPLAGAPVSRPALDPRKFQDPERTLSGEARARVRFRGFETLWFNTGTLCNLACKNCYIESSPKNDRLAFLSAADVLPYLDEARALASPPGEIGFTGGEPFVNPDILELLQAALSRGFSVLVLTDAMKPLALKREGLKKLKDAFGAKLTLRVSIDHWRSERHDAERGPGSFAKMIENFRWLIAEGFAVDVAGRTAWGEAEEELRQGYARFFAEIGAPLDAFDPRRLILFPEMDERIDVPEISVSCWGKLNKRPEDQMCATSRMVVKEKGADRPQVQACTLLAYDSRFRLGATLAEAAAAEVALNHPHCAKFCVLGGGSCAAR